MKNLKIFIGLIVFVISLVISIPVSAVEDPEAKCLETGANLPDKSADSWPFCTKSGCTHVMSKTCNGTNPQPLGCTPTTCKD